MFSIDNPKMADLPKIGTGPFHKRYLGCHFPQLKTSVPVLPITGKIILNRRKLVDIFSAPDESDKRFTYRFLSIQNYSFVSMLHQYFIEDCTRKLFGCQKHADRIMHWYENSEVIVDDVSAYFIQFISEYGAYFDSHLSLKQFLEK